MKLLNHEQKEKVMEQFASQTNSNNFIDYVDMVAQAQAELTRSETAKEIFEEMERHFIPIDVLKDIKSKWEG